MHTLVRLHPSSSGVGSHKCKKSCFNKTIALVSLTSPDPKKPSTSNTSSHLDYKVITQVIISMEAGACSPSSVAEKVWARVSGGSSDFWKHNRKILAASKSLYTKLTGSSTNPSRATSEQMKMIMIALRNVVASLRKIWVS